ncbi:MAG: hypothetical protein JSS49_18295 [Planctomycetes bacterium]|nr:hypothetical protein [Planctomycetota bacterium]
MRSRCCGMLGVLIFALTTLDICTAESPPSAQFVLLDGNHDGILDYSESIAGAGDALVYRHWVFFESDLDDDDRLTEAEYIGWTGGRGLRPVRDFLRRDVDRSGTIALKEFMQWAPETALASNTRNFRLVDFDGNDQLSLDEFRALPAGGLADRGPVPDPLRESARQKLAEWKEIFTRTDANTDGRLVESEWPETGFGDWTPMGRIPFADWDRDKDGGVTTSEGQQLISVAYGIRRADGEMIRLPSGLLLDYVTMRRLDKDLDGKISRDEFVAGYWRGAEKNLQLLTAIDTDHDGQATVPELLAAPGLVFDVVGTFAHMDQNFNGKLDRDEILKFAAPWQKRLGSRLIPAFDADSDGELSLQEYRTTPFANVATDWYPLRQDIDHDGKLSFAEFYHEASPLFIGQYFEVFRKLDLNHDDQLTSDEYDYTVDFQKAPADRAFAVRDRDHDQQLTADELLGETLSPDADAAAKARFAIRQTFIHNLIQQADPNGDGEWNLAEYLAAAPEPLLAMHRDFVRYDADADGRVSVTEYITPFIGGQWEKNVRIESVLGDVNDDGLLSWPEFQILPPKSPTPALRFSVLDVNADGKLTLKELLHIVSEQSRAANRLQHIRQDVNDDGFLDLAEYLAPPTAGRSLTREFRARDLDQDGAVTLDEFLSIYGPEHRREGTRNFHVADFDADQNLSIGEFSVLPGTGATPAERGMVPDPIADLSARELETWRTQLRARNGDSGIRKTDWPSLQWAGASVGLADVPFEDWDLNHDGRVTDDEGTTVFSRAFGLTTAAGDVIRRSNGLSVYTRNISWLDADKNGAITREEFIASFSMGAEKNAEIFQLRDLDGDGRLTVREASEIPEYQPDMVGAFLWWDTDQNGFIDPVDLGIRSAPWHRPMLATVIAAFDADHDGHLSFAEFRETPFLETSWDWYQARDLDHDGLLAWKEFFPDKGPTLAGVARFYFDKFDLNHDGQVSFDEMEFKLDLNRLGPQIRFGVLDRNHDSRLTVEELQIPPAPASGEAAAVARDVRIRQYRDEWFASADANHDAFVTTEEFAVVVTGYFPTAFETFVKLDTSGHGRLSYADYVRPTLGSQWEQAANDEARLFDVNDDGGLSWTEFQITPRAAPTLEQWLAGLDANQDAMLSLNEYLHTIRADQQPSSRRTFHRFDRDGDGLVNREEWLGQGQGPISMASEFRCRDDDGDGELTMDEFVVFAGAEWHDHFRRNFRLADQDSNARLSLEEFRCIPGMGPFKERGGLKDAVVSLMEKQLEPVLELVRRKDGDGDGRLSLREWPTADIKAIAADLGAIAARDWDRDHDGFISAAECRVTLEDLFGIVLPNGSRLHLKNGHVVNLAMLRQYDSNSDNQISRQEFVSRFWKSPQENQDIFSQRDLNKNGQWEWNEIEASPEMSADIFAQFTWYDTNLDGMIDQRELDDKMATWQKSLGSRLIVAFSDDGTRLSFPEFQVSPFGNPVADWYALRVDHDHDARLSWDEFYDGKSPHMIGLFREMFARLDRNHDGSLTFDELEFSVDLDKITPETAFRMLDKDHDGKLAFGEVFTETKPADVDKAGMERYEMRLAASETRFLADDLDHNGSLSVEEFQRSKEAALRAVERKTKALSRHRGNKPSDLPFIAFLVVDALVLLGAAYYFLKPRKSS